MTRENVTSRYHALHHRCLSRCAWSVFLQIRRGKNRQHVRQLHYQRAPSRWGSLLRRGNGAFRSRVQTRRRIDGAVLDLRQYFYFRRDHRLVRLWHTDSRTTFRRFRPVDGRNVPAGTLMDSYQVGDRRPLASRSWKISERIARWLSRRGATPNAISIAGMFCGIAAGIMFFETSRVSHPCSLLAPAAHELVLDSELIEAAPDDEVDELVYRLGSVVEARREEEDDG